MAVALYPCFQKVSGDDNCYYEQSKENQEYYAPTGGFVGSA